MAIFAAFVLKYRNKECSNIYLFILLYTPISPRVDISVMRLNQVRRFSVAARCLRKDNYLGQKQPKS